jgi:SAM-dependent methyltransferase
MTVTAANIIHLPQPKYVAAVEGSENIFRERFGHLSADQWRDVLVRSISYPLIEGIEFPKFPDRELQMQIHGEYGADALRDPYLLYCFIQSQPQLHQKLGRNSVFLDFGCGWGRISRIFMRDFDLERMYGFEPQRGTCFMARTLNPYMCFLNGGDTPDGTLPADRFDLVLAWSVFSHLSEASTIHWFEELARVMRPDAYCVASTWGERFLNLLIQEQRKADQGLPIHWYHLDCLQAAGNVVAHRNRYRAGQFTWFGPAQSKHYGSASFLPAEAIHRVLKEARIPLELVGFDNRSLTQDVFILRRR